ncbi:MAG: winged helix-turn-helix domain-containing protein [Clostridiales bacterium]|nr:winged helix-turn-helix domain-containing protein [Clostridiales bacterium]
MLLLSFENDEEKLLNSVLAALGTEEQVCTLETMKPKSLIKIDGLFIDFEERKVVRSGEAVNLTYTEFEILQLLAQNPGRIFSKEQIYDSVWKEPYAGDYNIVMSHIYHIRHKIESVPEKPVYIQTVWGVGYKFNEKKSSSR